MDLLWKGIKKINSCRCYYFYFRLTVKTNVSIHTYKMPINIYYRGYVININIYTASIYVQVCVSVRRTGPLGQWRTSLRRSLCERPSFIKTGTSRETRVNQHFTIIQNILYYYLDYLRLTD